MPDLRDVIPDADVRSRLERVASQRHEAVDALVEEAIRQFVDREEHRARFQGAALAAWDEYEATGLHATADEVDDWLGRLEAGDVVPPPRCHD